MAAGAHNQFANFFQFKGHDKKYYWHLFFQHNDFLHDTLYLTSSILNPSMTLEPILPHARIFNHVHVVKPDILHAPLEVLTHVQCLAGLQERVYSSKVDLKITQMLY